MHDPNKLHSLQYRNAMYQGPLCRGMFHSKGVVLNQDFLYCLATWHQDSLQGPCLVVFPDETIMCGRFAANEPQGVFSLQQGRDYQLFITYDHGSLAQCVAVFEQVGAVYELTWGQDNEANICRSEEFQDSEAKWAIIGRFLNFDLHKSDRRYDYFVQSEFNQQYLQIGQLIDRQLLVSFRQEGIGIKIKRQSNRVSAVGIMNFDKQIVGMGRKLLNSVNDIKQQGLQNKPETLVSYQNRPQAIRRLYRDQFRQGIHFQNKFLVLKSIDKIQKELAKFHSLLQSSGIKKMAQQKIEGTPYRVSYIPRENAEPVTEVTAVPKFQIVRAGQVVIESETRIFGNQVSIEHLKKQLERSLSHGKARPDNKRQPPSAAEPIGIEQRKKKQRFFDEFITSSPHKASYKAIEKTSDESKLQQKAYVGSDLLNKQQTTPTNKHSKYCTACSPQKQDESHDFRPKTRSKRPHRSKTPTSCHQQCRADYLTKTKDDEISKNTITKQTARSPNKTAKEKSSMQLEKKSDNNQRYRHLGYRMKDQSPNKTNFGYFAYNR